MPTAQEVYAAMLRAQLAPRLRALGFKGSGNVFDLPSGTHWIRLGFQKSSYSSADHVRFTANVLVVSRPAWERLRSERGWPARPSPGVLYGPSVSWARIGHLLPGGQDTWWSVRSDGQEADRLAALISHAVRDYVLPAVTAIAVGARS